MSEDQFLALTPRLFDALVERFMEAEKRHDLRAGIQTAWLLAPHRGKGEPLTPSDIYPSLAPPKKSATPAELMAQFKRATTGA